MCSSDLNPDHVIGVGHFQLRVALNLAGGHRTRSFGLDGGPAGRRVGQGESHLLEVEHDIRHVLQHVGERGQLVLHALQLDGRDGVPVNAREQGPAQGVAQRQTKTGAGPGGLNDVRGAYRGCSKDQARAEALGAGAVQPDGSAGGQPGRCCE